MSRDVDQQFFEIISDPNIVGLKLAEPILSAYETESRILDAANDSDVTYLAKLMIEGYEPSSEIEPYIDSMKQQVGTLYLLNNTEITRAILINRQRQLAQEE